MGDKTNNEMISISYVDVIKSRLHEFDDEILSGDADILCKYIVLRFLKTSPDIAIATKAGVVEKLESFINDIWPFVIAFVHVANSSPLTSPTSELFGTVMEDSEA